MPSPSIEPFTQAIMDAHITALVDALYTAIANNCRSLNTRITKVEQHLTTMTSNIANQDTDNLTKIRAKTRPGSPFVATKRLLALYKQEDLVLEAWEQEFRTQWVGTKKKALDERLEFLCQKKKEWDGMQDGLARREEEIMEKKAMGWGKGDEGL